MWKCGNVKMWKWWKFDVTHVSGRLIQYAVFHFHIFIFPHFHILRDKAKTKKITEIPAALPVTLPEAFI